MQVAWSSVATVLCDLDGVVWLAHEPIPGSADAVERIRASGRRVLFVTNNSWATDADQVAALGAIGIPAVGDVISSATAAARMVTPGSRVLVAAGPGVVEALERRDVDPVLNDGRVDPDGFDAVIVGMHRDIDYARIAVASSAVRAGARLIGTNTDSTYPTPTGLLPGGGALLAAIATAAGVDPEVAGKPHQPMADVVAEAAPAGGGGLVARLMVGDRLETDGRFAGAARAYFALVRSGVTTVEHDATSPTADGVGVDLDVADLAAVADVLDREPFTGH